MFPINTDTIHIMLSSVPTMLRHTGASAGGRDSSSVLSLTFNSAPFPLTSTPFSVGALSPLAPLAGDTWVVLLKLICIKEISKEQDKVHISSIKILGSKLQSPLTNYAGRCCSL